MEEILIESFIEYQASCSSDVILKRSHTYFFEKTSSKGIIFLLNINLEVFMTTWNSLIGPVVLGAMTGGGVLCLEYRGFNLKRSACVITGVVLQSIRTIRYSAVSEGKLYFFIATCNFPASFGYKCYLEYLRSGEPGFAYKGLIGSIALIGLSWYATENWVGPLLEYIQR